MQPKRHRAGIASVRTLGCFTMIGVVALALASCTHSGARARTSSPSARTGPSTSSESRPDLRTMCDHPTARASTAHTVGVGSPGAPTIGAHSFHPYPYQPGFPTKMIVYQVTNESRTIYLRGWRCSDGRVLRLWYDEGDPQLMGTPPYSEAKLMRLGEVAATIPPGTGYALFSSPGAWVLAVSDRTHLLGSLRIDVSICGDDC